MTTTDPFTEAAEVASWEDDRHPDDMGAWSRMKFMRGALWARTHLAAQEPTEDDVPESVANLIRDLIDSDDCWFDHSGGCQAHGYLSLTPEQECPHSEAKRLLADRAARRDEEKR